MTSYSYITPQFNSGDKIITIVDYSRQIKGGTPATIFSPQVGLLYAVQLPSEEIYRWFSEFELQPVQQKQGNALQIGDFAKVLTAQGHAPSIKKDMIVKIIKITTPVAFYDVILDDGSYHRWLAEFEITKQI